MWNCLQQALDKQKAEANDQAEKLVQYHILQHDAESNKQLYDGLLQKLKEAGITAGLRSSNIRVVDPALAPDEPFAAAKSAGISFWLFWSASSAALAWRYSGNTSTTP